MKSNMVLLPMAAALLSGCEVIFNPPTPAPEEVSGLTYKEMRELFGKIEFQKGEFTKTRGHSHLPTSCEFLSNVRDYDNWLPSRSKIEYHVRHCEQSIEKERASRTQWMDKAEDEYQEWKARQIAQEEAEAQAEKDRRKREDLKKQRIEQARREMYDRLDMTYAYSKMRNLEKKSIVFPNSQLLGEKDIGLVAGCLELGFEPSNVKYRQSGKGITVTYDNAQVPRGTMDIEIDIVENDQYWLVSQAIVDGREFNRTINLAPLIVAGLRSGGCTI